MLVPIDARLPVSRVQEIQQVLDQTRIVVFEDQTAQLGFAEGPLTGGAEERRFGQNVQMRGEDSLLGADNDVEDDGFVYA